jgi:hypothetical protein
VNAEYLRGVLNALHEQGCPLESLILGVTGDCTYAEFLDPIDVDIDQDGEHGSFTFNIP